MWGRGCVWGVIETELVEIVAKRFSDELGQKLPPERKLGNSEDSRMNIFDAVALVLILRLI